MKNILTRLIAVCLLTLCLQVAQTQIGYGLAMKTDLYNRYTNPEDGVPHRSVGSALLNIGFGPKIWFGGDQFSFSAETGVNFSPFAFDVNEFKGLGAASFPILAKINFGGLTGMNKQGKVGFSLGGGLQYNRTELFGLRNQFKALGAERSFYRTYVVEAAVGFGLSGFNLQFFTRYGWNSNLDADALNFGIAYDFNLPTLKKLTDPEF